MIDDEEPAGEKYWITDFSKTATNPQYQIRITLVHKPNDEEEIIKWMKKSYPRGTYDYRADVSPFYYAEIFFRTEGDSLMFMLRWSRSFA